MNTWGWIGMFRRFLAVALCVTPAAFCADKSILELQRDVAALQEQVRGLQKSLDDKLAELAQKQGNQVRAAADLADKSLASIGDRMQKSLQDRQVGAVQRELAARQPEDQQEQTVADEDHAPVERRGEFAMQSRGHRIVAVDHRVDRSGERALPG